MQRNLAVTSGDSDTADVVDAVLHSDRVNLDMCYAFSHVAGTDLGQRASV